jgi:hypothetical protein
MNDSDAPQIFEFGGYVVNIKIKEMKKLDKDIAWVRGNSFVLVKDKNGPFTCNDEPCNLLSVNGIGEIRWYVQAMDIEAGLDLEAEGKLKDGWDTTMHVQAFHHFDLRFK